jgi:argininosuccinate lyase
MRKESTTFYTASIMYDWRLYRHDITGSLAHVRMLARQGIVSNEDAKLIVEGLTSICQEIQDNTFPWQEHLEDLHMNIEARLYEKIGPAAGKLHTARSRNDQVATDMRLYVKEIVGETLKHVWALQEALLNKAQDYKGLLMPGYTHLQRAQPVLLAHHLLAYFQMLRRDAVRLKAARTMADVLPLGSGALAGSPYPLDRDWVAQELGFANISDNSMDAVSDRDFVLDYLYAAAVTMSHLSRLGEELILWSTEEFGFVRIEDSFTTGSSIMPQKRNPDFAELARGRTGRTYGNLLGLLTTIKGLPLTYNRDLQEDKEALFDSVDTLLPTLEVFSGMVAGLKFDAKRMQKAAEGGYSLATDLADYLVIKGMPFREAHGVVAALSRYAEEKEKTFQMLSLVEYHSFSSLFDEDVYKINLRSAVASRNVPGGTAPLAVEQSLAAARQWLKTQF